MPSLAAPPRRDASAVISLRPSGFDELGLRRALSDRMLPLLVAAMTFLAALALAGWFGIAALSRHWREGAGSALTVQVPDAQDKAADGDTTRLAAVLNLLTGTPGVTSAHALTNEELAALLRPWLGNAAASTQLAVPVPAVIAVRLNQPALDVGPMARRLEQAAPGTMVEDHNVWIRRLTLLTRSLQACAGLALVIVAAVAAAVVAVATRAGLTRRREAIEIVHGLGASDSYIAGRFASRVTWLAAAGAAGGGLVALPVLLVLANLAAPFGSQSADLGDWTTALTTVPAAMWASLPCLPVLAAAIGFLTAQGTVRRWLRRLP
ncbi:cell division protein FtsX [Rhodopila sp.]|uniref:cell division protein FtsX n=1 Tax=Rhodopila sp. TaxID=2480087 RepID=UPI002C1E4030|nr:FtsX-like permease family protein [Rhodopila sp.]HVZ09854.1 FtsX-like permease family protein [Rhodopila sp.]